MMLTYLNRRLKPLIISTVFRRNNFPQLITTNNKNISISNGNKRSKPVSETLYKKQRTTDDSENWISYGYDYENKFKDRYIMHLVWFSSITLVLVGGSFLVMYSPDIKNRDWAGREGYLELNRRETLGLPLIDPDLIPREKFLLQTEEELGDLEIII